MNDPLFWYAGAAVWFVIALVLALSVFIAGVFAVCHAYYTIRKWNLLWQLCYMTEDEMQEMRWSIHGGITEETLDKFRKENRRRLSQYARGPLMFPAYPNIGTLLEMNDGSVLKVVSQTNSDVKWTGYFQARDVTSDHSTPDWLEVQLDGRVKGHPVLRVVKVIEEKVGDK
jgi:hypothetical protein